MVRLYPTNTPSIRIGTNRTASTHSPTRDRAGQTGKQQQHQHGTAQPQQRFTTLPPLPPHTSHHSPLPPPHSLPLPDTVSALAAPVGGFIKFHLPIPKAAPTPRELFDKYGLKEGGELPTDRPKPKTAEDAGVVKEVSEEEYLTPRQRMIEKSRAADKKGGGGGASAVEHLSAPVGLSRSEVEAGGGSRVSRLSKFFEQYDC